MLFWLRVVENWALFGSFLEGVGFAIARVAKRVRSGIRMERIWSLEARVKTWITSVWISGQLCKFAVKLQFMMSCVWLGLSAGLRTFTLVASCSCPVQSEEKREKKGKEKHSDASLEVSVTFLRWQVVLDCRLFRKLVLRFCFRCRCCFLASGVAGSIVWFFDGSVLVVEWLRVLCTF